MIHCNLINTSQKRAGVPSQPLSCLFLKWGSPRFDTRGSKKGIREGESVRPYTSLSLSFSLPWSFLLLRPSIILSLGARGPLAELRAYE